MKTDYIVLLVLLLIIGFLFILNMFTSNIDGFSELYFVGDLPEVVEKDKEYSFSFGINNMENKIKIYDYVISINGKIFYSGSTKLENDKKIVINNKFKVSDDMETVKISVSTKNHEIHFWADVI